MSKVNLIKILKYVWYIACLICQLSVESKIELKQQLFCIDRCIDVIDSFTSLFCIDRCIDVIDSFTSLNAW